MGSTVTLAWALPVNAETLPACLEAYAQTKTKMDVFRTCVRESTSALGRSPAEIIDIISENVHQSVYDAVYPVWQENYNCCSDYSRVYKVEQHANTLEGNSYQLEDYKWIFTEDFGLQINFNVLREYGEPIAYADGSGFRGAELERVGIEAFIIHPITTCDIRGNVGNNQASFSVMKHIDLAQVKSLTPEEAGRFDKAVKCLKLKIETGAGTDSSEQSSLSGSGNKDVTRQDVMTEASSQRPRLMILGSGTMYGADY